MTTNNRRHVKGRRKRFSGRARQAADGPPAITVDLCPYPGCLGPADGSECRHPRPEDEREGDDDGV
jgi:hypothetical protein